GEADSRVTVVDVGGAVVGGAELDTADIAELGDTAISADFDNDVGELTGFGETALGVDGVLELRCARGRGLTPDGAGGDLDVLFPDGVDDIAGGHVAGGELIG